MVGVRMTKNRAPRARDDVGHARRAMRDDFLPERPDADPGADRELEVLRHASFEEKTAFGIGFVDEAQRVADL